MNAPASASDRRGPRALLVLVAALALPWTVRIWTDDPNYSLGPLVWAWALWVAWRRPAARPAPAGWAVLALALLAVAWYAHSALLATLAVAAALLHVGLASGWSGTRVPALVLLLTVPPPGADGLLVALQGFVAAATVVGLHALGIAARQDALTLTTDHATYAVAPLCAGLSSLLAVLALLAIAAWHLGVRPGSLALTMLAGTAITVTLNIVRILVLVVVTERTGPGLITGLGHEAVGIALALLAVALCLPLLLRSQRRARRAKGGRAGGPP